MISCTEVVGLSLSTYLKIDIDYLKYRSSIILIYRVVTGTVDYDLNLNLYVVLTTCHMIIILSIIVLTITKKIVE